MKALLLFSALFFALSSTHAEDAASSPVVAPAEQIKPAAQPQAKAPTTADTADKKLEKTTTQTANKKPTPPAEAPSKEISDKNIEADKNPQPSLEKQPEKQVENKAENQVEKKAEKKVQTKTDEEQSKKPSKKATRRKSPKQIFATLHISIDEKKLEPVKIKLFHRRSPKTVENFVGLAEGTKTHSIQGRIGKPFYDGMIFHRISPGYVIQTGDPKGNGTGGPGYKFANEIYASLKHDRAGIVAMANAGPNTNGSQFYITVKPAPFLDGSYSIFGEVISGLDSVFIANKVPVDRMERPKKKVKLDKITIEKIYK